MDNQTEQKWLEDQSPDALGTGVFLIPNLEIDEYAAMEVKAIRNITYKQCCIRGAFVAAFKWVPNSIEDFESICLENCTNGKCVKTCIKPGCICNPYLGICQSVNK